MSTTFPKLAVTEPGRERRVMSVEDFQAEYPNALDERTLRWVLNGEVAGAEADRHKSVCRYTADDCLRDAAADLLAACELTVKAHPLNGNTNCEECIASRAAEAAIAKAKGVALGS